MSIKIYGLEKCDTCRKARNWLDRRKVAYEFIDYREHRVDAATLKTWAQAADGWDKLINRTSTTWYGLPNARKSPGSPPEWLLLLKEYPALIRRPLVVLDDGRVHQGFTDKRFTELFPK
ncbi:MAG: Spx/MgsR family RNA polymerase-binding regulatory protein [Rhodanobacter sp.]|jgi:Spx/MgsR family transcriptional regulator|nr:Spx/MgsR family RNA polymerase-binding regulatory protein [Rhodanobacter sp.]